MRTWALAMLGFRRHPSAAATERQVIPFDMAPSGHMIVPAEDQ